MDHKTEHTSRPHRLINTHTLTFAEFHENDAVPPYAILSHRWITLQEITFEEFQLVSADPSLNLKYKPGYKKISEACSKAQKDNIDFIWVDTCCINRADHGESARDIMGMYGYYANAVVCYVYMVDVWRWKHLVHDSEKEIVEEETSGPLQWDGKIFRLGLEEETSGPLRWQRGMFEDSEWFERGWTLQELLAPSTVVFFDRHFNRIGDKGKLKLTVASLTGISPADIDGTIPSRQIEPKTRMAWAIGRKTTKPQDRAYCLLGILDVSLEPNYSEDIKRAFARLQSVFLDTHPEQAEWLGNKGVGDHDGDGANLYSILIRKGVDAFVNNSPAAYHPEGDSSGLYPREFRERIARTTRIHGGGLSTSYYLRREQCHQTTDDEGVD
ncbi:hypothetical protein D9758_016526 [Tetrapyrgos nigripes]|uniref:Heterokaryon incompatibility domain-containing protein n=1 Tax=Tetrapyrgos nigripes TaxID=182062 RepID=A0A8H5CMQ8_9AGAR|nr:hypothetical protein D9758_016526 [Tetrapyrgos nigripes]